MPEEHRNRGDAAPRPRRRRKSGFLALVVAIFLLFIVAFLATRLLKGGAPTVAPQAESDAPVSASPVASAPAESAPDPLATLPPATGEFDVEGLPLLCNYNHPIPDDYVLDLVGVGGNQQLQAPAAAAFMSMQAAARADGVELVPVSGYRTNQRQTSNYNSSIQRYLSQGYSQADAEAATNRYYAIPGTSEHEAALAMDIGMIDDSFENTAAFAWLQENAADYGFIMRYRAETEETWTHIAYEPWHYRFVGANHAHRIAELGGITLEEYTERYAGAGEKTADTGLG